MVRLSYANYFIARVDSRSFTDYHYNFPSISATIIDPFVAILQLIVRIVSNCLLLARELADIYTIDPSETIEMRKVISTLINICRLGIANMDSVFTTPVPINNTANTACCYGSYKQCNSRNDARKIHQDKIIGLYHLISTELSELLILSERTSHFD